MPIRFTNILPFLCLILLGSCSNFEKIRKSSDVNFKLTKANELFDKKDYAHANELYKELMPIMKNTRNFEPLFYRYAYTYYYLRDFVEASYYFKNFTEYFPTSKDAEECEFMSAVCLFKFAPKYTLDQTNTLKALEALQSYTTRYPASKRIAEANNYIKLGNNKLESKAADAAKLYFNMGQYKAATVAYGSVLRNYPESPSADLYQFMIFKATYRFAKGSIPERQEERYASAIGLYRELKDNYPTSKYLDEATKLNQEANNNVKKIRNEYQ